MWVGGLHAASFPPLPDLEFTPEMQGGLQDAENVGSGDRQQRSIQALLSDTGQGIQSLFFLICKVGVMCLCHRIAARTSDNEFEGLSTVPGGCDGVCPH